MTRCILPALMAVVIALVPTLPLMRISARFLERILPTDESSALPRAALVGYTATIVIGEARHGYPARAKVRDRFGQSHYLLLEPENIGDQWKAGKEVLLVRTDGVRYYAIDLPDEELPFGQNA